MDEEHMELLRRMQKLEGLSRSMTTKPNLLAAFDSVIDLARLHFVHEEALQKKMNYPNADAHKKVHEDLISKLMKYRQELDHSVYSALPSSVFDFFQNWLLTHILIVDRQYAEFAEKNGFSYHSKFRSS